MTSLRRPYLRTVCVLLALLALGAVALFCLRGTPPAQAASVGTLQQQISSGRGQVSALAGALGAASARVGALDRSIAAIRAQIAGVQRQLNGDRAQLLRLRAQLTAARTRLQQLEAFETKAEGVLSRQLVNAYESDRPDIVTVVLESRGFNDLLERLDFAERVSKQSARIVNNVKAARRAVAAQATRLGALQERQQQLTAQVLTHRNSLTSDRVALVRQQLAAAQAQQAKASQLAGARSHVRALQSQLSQLQAQQAAAATAAERRSSPASGSSSGSGSSSSSGGAPPAAPSSGGFTFPLPKSAVSPPGTWSLDQGVDMSAPGDTPEYAVCSGTIVLHGIGGFGPWAPVLHCDSSLSGYSYVYYGHAGPANQLPVGTHVGAGQVMSSIGPGIVGISSGPHLEIGFADSAGGPIGGGSASTMMSLLQSSY